MIWSEITRHGSSVLSAIRTGNGVRVALSIDGVTQTVQLTRREGYALAAVCLSTNDHALVERLARSWVGPEGEIGYTHRDGIRAVLAALEDF